MAHNSRVDVPFISKCLNHLQDNCELEQFLWELQNKFNESIIENITNHLNIQGTLKAPKYYISTQKN